jgi:hypothetical protein
MQIAFLTLFLGLVSGQQPVGLVAGQGVAVIELRLDGAPAGRVTAPQWSETVDFGPLLLPHHLEALARDAQGQEVAKAEQWLNVPRPPAEVEVVFAHSDASDPGRARLTWQSVTDEDPSSVSLDIDGTQLHLDASRSVALPPRPNNDETRVLTARVLFPSGLEARRIYALGREFGDAVATDLTAVPVRWAGGGEMPPAPQLSGWLTEGGHPLAVNAVEGGDARILVVRDPAARKALGKWTKYDAESGRMKGAAAEFLWPTSQRHEGSGIAADLFPRSQGFDLSTQGLLFLAGRVLHDGEGQSEARLADAVAVAGLAAAAEQRPRAVLLLLSSKSGADRSRYSPAEVRRYLSALGVPLYIWLVDNDPKTATAAAWGEVEPLAGGSLGGVTRAWAKLSLEVSGQRIVWVEGKHLPESIRLSAQASRLQLLTAR